MNKEYWRLEEVILKRIREFEKAHPTRETISREVIQKNPKIDGKVRTTIRYYSLNSEKTNFYGFLSENYCHCECGAGHLNLLVVDLEKEENLPEATEKIYRYLEDVNSYKKMNWYPIDRKDTLFEILTGKAGKRGAGSWISQSEISGIETPYYENISLISALTLTNLKGGEEK